MPPAPPPLRACLLSGGASHRMGHDKALLLHPEGGTWLERQLRLLAGLGAPVTLLSGWPAHLARATALAGPFAAAGVELELLLEPHGPLGPLVALNRLMDAHPNERLLLCPTDMPALTPACLQALLDAASATPNAIWIASADVPPGRRQPLLGLYPSDARPHQSLRRAVARGERGLQRWLAGEPVHALPLPAAALANVNTPQELDAWRAEAHTTARVASEPL
ncbi:MAG: molybdenum cofactor guanylyltransferase [Cyanobacteriota bacterium]|nr:molybdenum cofactor guanylyltransferase [Cyanobacteriota bacterium]